MAAEDQMAQDEGRIPARADNAFDEWMARFAELDDAAVDDLLRGETPVGHDDLAPVAEIAAAVRQRATARGPEMGPALRSQIQARPHVPPRFAATARRRLRLVTAAAVALMIVGVAATQNALPAAAQRFVSDAADLVGLHVPRPEEGRGQTPDDTGEPSGSTQPTDADATEPPVTADGAPSGTPGEDPSATGAGPPEETPGGATPADPGTPGDGEPATPATPPANSNGGGNDNNAGGNPDNNGNDDGSGAGRDTAPGQTGSRGASDQD